ncbi:MAG: hypothetical protein ACQEQU_01140 [Spirochaetota bacterium]
MFTGSVPGSVGLSVEPNQDVGAFNVTVKQDNLLVGYVHELANVRSGYRVILRSVNASAVGSANPFLRSESEGDAHVLQYQVHYGDHLVTFDQDGTAIITETDMQRIIGSRTNGIYISYDGTDTPLIPGYYTDTLMFEIVPK